MADARIKDLTTEPTLGYDYQLAIDKTGLLNAVNMDLATILRTKVGDTVNESGNPTATADFTDATVINMIIDEDCAISFTGITNNETVTLILSKGSADVATFPTATGTNDSSQVGRTSVIFEITSNGSSYLCKQLNDQFGGDLLIGNLSLAGSTITTFNYFRYEINNNVCNFWADFDFQYTGVIALNKLTLTISSWNINTVQSEVAIAVFVTGDTAINAAMGKISKTSADIWFNVQPTTGDTNNLKFSGSFKIT